MVIARGQAQEKRDPSRGSGKDGTDATTFLYPCDEEWVPTLNEEHDAWLWVQPNEALREMA
jgi:hypothetical protein